MFASPLLFLAIPIIVFVIGSGLLHLVSRARTDDVLLRRAPDDLRAVVPMLREQRASGFPVGSGNRSVRS